MLLRHLAFCALVLILSYPAGARAQDDLQDPVATVPTIEPSGVLKGHEKAIHGVAFSPDGKQIVSAGEDVAIVWDASTGKSLRRLDPGEGRLPAYSVAFAPDGKTLAVGGYVGDVFLWDVATGKFKGKLDEPSLAVLCLAYSPDGSIIAASHDQAEVMLFDTKESKLLGKIKPSKGGIKSFAFSADGKTLAALTDYELSTWDVPTRTLRKSLALPGTGISWLYTAVACAPKASVVVASGGELMSPKTIAYDLKTLRPMGGLETSQFEPSIKCLRFSPDGKILASGGSGKPDRTPVTLWDVSTGRRLAELIGASDSLTQIAFSPDGRRIVAAGFDKSVHVWTLSAAPASGTPKAKTKMKAKAKKTGL
jgi:WD40 repeat protein